MQHQMAQKVAQLGKLKRVQGFYDLFDDIFISEDVGYEKPDITYFKYIKEKTHYDHRYYNLLLETHLQVI